MMKKVITTVGTSIFTKENDYKKSIEGSYKDIKEKREKEWKNNEKPIKYIKDKIKNNLNRSSSAEIKSISLLKQKLEEELDVYFICTDTISSRLAAEILKDYFEKEDKLIKIFFEPEKDVIDDLQVEDSENFLKGMVNLINRFDSITSEYYENIILNITGGFKALIPYMTVLGQVNKIPIYYVFEETDNLIKIPPVPIDINDKIFETYEREFELLENGEIKQKSEFSHNFLTDCSTCIEIDGNLIILNPLGKILWNKYISKYCSLYCSDQVFRDIEKYKDIKRIMQTKYYHIIDGQKIEKKLDHYVFDDGHNNNRIYFFKEDNNLLFIYKVFTNHDEAEKFIDTPFGDEDRKRVKKEAKIRRLLKIKEE